MATKINTRKIFNIAMADMNEEYALVWKPITNYIIVEKGDTKYKATPNALFPNRPITSPSDLDLDYNCTSTYLYTKEQRNLNKDLGLTKIETINKFYKKI